MHQCIKFGHHRSSRCRDIAVFRFLKMAGVCHLGFLKVGTYNCQSSFEGQHASPCQILCRLVKPLWSYGRFLIFQVGGRPPSCIFKSTKFSVPMRFSVPICVIMLNFVPVGQVKLLQRYGCLGIFQLGVRPPSWIFKSWKF